MGETKKIVIEGFPVDKLPEELRAQLTSGEPVRITVEQGSGEPLRRSLLDFYGSAKGLYASQGLDPVEFIRQLRDEFD